MLLLNCHAQRPAERHARSRAGANFLLEYLSIYAADRVDRPSPAAPRARAAAKVEVATIQALESSP